MAVRRTPPTQDKGLEFANYTFNADALRQPLDNVVDLGLREAECASGAEQWGNRWAMCFRLRAVVAA